MRRKIIGAFVVLLGMSLLAGNASATTIFVDDQAGFDTAVAGLTFEGTEDWESSTLADNNLIVLFDPIEPGVANGPFPTGTNSDTGLTVQANTLGDNPTSPSPSLASNALATASPGLSGTPTHQVSQNADDSSFDMIFGLTDTLAVSFTPLIFDINASGADGEVNIRVYDTSNILIAEMLDILIAGFMDPTTFIGIVAMPGEDIGRINIFGSSIQGQTLISAGADNIDVYTGETTVKVPEPGSLALFATGLAVLGFFGRRRRKAV